MIEVTIGELIIFALILCACSITVAVKDRRRESEWGGRKNPGPTTKPPTHIIPMSRYEATGDPKYKDPK